MNLSDKKQCIDFITCTQLREEPLQVPDICNWCSNFLVNHTALSPFWNGSILKEKHFLSFIEEPFQKRFGVQQSK